MHVIIYSSARGHEIGKPLLLSTRYLSGLTGQVHRM